MIGYDAFAFIPPVVKLDKAITQRDHEAGRAIREYLSFRAGMQEIFTYPWVDRRMLEAAGIRPEDCLELATPPAPDTACLRPSLVPGLLEAVVVNQRHFDTFRIYEMAQVFRPGETHPSDPDETLPEQPRLVGGALTGLDPVGLFRAAKGILEEMPRIAMGESYALEQREKPAWADPKIWLNMVMQDEVIGSVGVLSAKSAAGAGIKRLQTALFELRTDRLRPLPSRENRFRHLPVFPLVELDLSVLLDESVSWAELEQLVLGVANRCVFVEEYRGKQIPAGKKSVMFRYWLGSDQGTLTAEQIEAETARLIKRIGKTLGGEIRQPEPVNG
jgi:phenylalanyl-tRNA synthetase beta chain